MAKKGMLSRRALLAGGVAAGAGAWAVERFGRVRAEVPRKRLKNRALLDKRRLAVVKGADPRRMVRKAVGEAIGGMDKLVGRGDRVVIKPNMSWDRSPALAANTNPAVVAGLVEMCVEAGARTVDVLDHTCNTDPRVTYAASGIAAAARAAGARIRMVRPGDFVTVDVEGGRRVRRWPYLRDVLACDVLINAAVAKHHTTSKLTMVLKNSFGMVGGDRGRLHRNIHETIPDIAGGAKADLAVLDAFRILIAHGPTGGNPDDVREPRLVAACADPVAVDAWGATLFGHKPWEIGFIANAADRGMGEADFRKIMGPVTEA
jgi:uncharacterized protein (DUF362 family)